MARTIVVADIHLTKAAPAALVADLVRVVEAHPGDRIVFDGDLFDLSAEPDAHADRAAAVHQVLDVHATFRDALARHVAGPASSAGALWFVAGNHDAEVGTELGSEALRDALGARGEAGARLRTTPWFFEDGGVHYEHGHLFDPDNAPAHPLVDGDASLGVLFVERFIAKTGAHRYLNANDAPPLGLFLSAFRWYGRRGPFVVYTFFETAVAALAKSGARHRGEAERAAGSVLEAAFAEAAGTTPAVLRALLKDAAEPTLASTKGTFFRLYLDRVAASLALSGGLGALALGRTRLGASSVAIGAAVMGASWARRHDRYSGRVEATLRRCATRVAEITSSKVVVFGHTHVEALESTYANTGSFAFPRAAPGRPYLAIDDRAGIPIVERRYIR
jgi:UDP-2,3-diacylglucosamine pyrophosphatase LpxH